MHRTIRVLLFAPLFALCVFAANLEELIDSARTAQREHAIPAAQTAYEAAFELAISERSLRLTSTAVEVSNFYSKQNYPAKAEETLMRAVDAEDRLKVAPIQEVPLLINLVDLYSADRRLADRASIQSRLVKAWEIAAGPKSVVVANNLYRLARTQADADDLHASEQSIQRAIAILEKTYGADAPSAAYAHIALSRIELKLRKSDAATAASQHANEILRNVTTVPGAVPVGGGVSAPRIVSKQDPMYSEEGRKAHIQGTILLSLVVDKSGNPQDLTVLLPLGAGLDEAVIQAVRKWRFQPGTRNGVPVPVKVTAEVNLKML